MSRRSLRTRQRSVQPCDEMALVPLNVKPPVRCGVITWGVQMFLFFFSPFFVLRPSVTLKRHTKRSHLCKKETVPKIRIENPIPSTQGARSISGSSKRKRLFSDFVAALRCPFPSPKSIIHFLHRNLVSSE